MHLLHATTFAIATASLALSSPLDLPPNYDRFAPRVENITWGPCPGPDTPARCGRFEVPLDYRNATAGKASLAVGRYPATKQPKLGTLFFNPGGPGGSGIGFILGTTAPFVSNVTDGQYDLVSWDPRGVNWTYPWADCFATGTEQKIFWNDSMPFAGIEARGNFTDQADLDSFYAQAPKVDELLVKLGQKCLQYGPDTFQYLGTAAVARDIVAMHDYLEGPDKPINFWGVSYGSVLGLYLVNMFPDRVGRVVIDSVTDPEYWSQRPSYEFWGVSIQSADDVFNGFVTNCAAAGPGSCALASNGSTPDSLKQDVQNIIDMAYDYKKTSGANAAFGSALVRSLLRKAMYEPTTWPAAAQSLASVPELIKNGLNSSGPNASMKRSLETGMSLLPHALFPRQQNPSNSSDPAMSYAEPTIVCGDSVDAGNVTSKMVFDDIFRVSKEVSHMFGPTWFSFHFCHRWPVRAVERYTGPFNKSLSNPVLVIGIETDPATPFVSAKKVADAFGDSAVLVEQDDYGHPSLAMYSDCTTTILGNYFRNGTLPSSDQFCATNQALFPGTEITNGAQWRTRWTVSSPIAGSVLLLTLILPHLL